MSNILIYNKENKQIIFYYKLNNDIYKYRETKKLNKLFFVNN